MKSIQSHRILPLNAKNENPAGDYVLYWMQATRRLNAHFGLQYAVAAANRLGKPLLIYEGLRSGYPWASDRFHTFIMEGMAEHISLLGASGITYFPYVERRNGEGRGLVRALSDRACTVVSDWFPTFIVPQQNKNAAEKCPVKFVAVDSNGILPMAISQKPAYSAFVFRRTVVQRFFKESWATPPIPDPLAEVQIRANIDLSDIFSKWEPAFEQLADIPSAVCQLPIDHSVKPLHHSPGTRREALERLRQFVGSRLPKYAELRNQPDETAYSGLSPYLHFGKIDAFEIVESVFATQPESWNPDQISFADGQRYGFFKGDRNVESFLDELITWRELGYHFCNWQPDFDSFETLPDWVRATLNGHDHDPRPQVYSLEELEDAKTYDPVWNAAQRQLVKDGIIHNYLRMLWGKKILEWSPSAEEALQRMIHLNNKYAIDGRNPNSYSGIMWTLGRFDRPWAPARPVFGTVRYMSSDSTLKKLRMKNYLEQFGEPKQQGSLGFEV